MSMCNIGFRAGGHISVIYLHYAQGILDHQKYHQWMLDHWSNRKTIDDYTAKQIAIEEKMAKGFVPEVVHDGCEQEAGLGGFWRCDTPKEQAKWRSYVRQNYEVCKNIPREECALWLDFTKQHAVIRDNGLCNWEDFLPDGWTHEQIESPYFAY